jgi:predicted cupin superfamily sugar epimerase
MYRLHKKMVTMSGQEELSAVPSWVIAPEDQELLGEACALGIPAVLLSSKTGTLSFVRTRKQYVASSSHAQTAAYWKQVLSLISHVEGGAYREMYRSPLALPHSVISAHGHKGVRAVSTSIYFLLEFGEFSAFHRIASDEMWHFYDGNTLCIYEIKPTGELIKHLLGKDVEAGAQLQIVVSANSWFASRVESNTEGASFDDNSKLFALVGCTVSPGFDFEDFELATRPELQKAFPAHHLLIEELTR